MDHISRLNELVQPRPLRIHLTDLSLQEQLLFPLVMNSIIDIIFCCFLIHFSSWLLSIITSSIFPCNNNYHLLLIIISISLLSSLGKIILILSWLPSVLLTSSVPEKKIVYPPDFYQYYQYNLYQNVIMIILIVILCSSWSRQFDQDLQESTDEEFIEPENLDLVTRPF